MVSNLEKIAGCFYAIERMRGMRVGETMLRRNNECLGETVLVGETMLELLNFVNDLVYSKPVFVTTLAENFASFIE
jgi:hypothetical protein